MPIQRLTGVVALASMLMFAVPAHAETRNAATTLSAVGETPAASPLSESPILNPAPRSSIPGLSSLSGALSTFSAGHDVLATAGKTAATPVANPAADDSVETMTDMRKELVALAMHLRDTRYVRGGHSPVTGFDCSGFVRYVFSHAIGVQLPTNSASQFLAGIKVKRADMKPGDLVFFHTSGRRHRVTHVGIYISDGRFIHAPTYGKTVQISSLGEAYWAKRFIGAKRPEGMLALAGRNG